MEIVPIFGENLYAVRYPDEEKDEFERLFELWQDPEFLESFFDEHQSDLKSGFWGDIGINIAIIETYDYASELEQRITELSVQTQDSQLSDLDEIFEPLHNSEIRIVQLGKRKTKRNWLRIYAIRVESNLYIITGGAIKLTRTMQEREHTKHELQKLEHVRRYLLERGIIDKEGLIEFIES